MHRKWFVIAGAAAALVLGTIGASPSEAQEKKGKHSKLHVIMEKVNRHNSVLQKGTRNAVFYKKAQKDVAKSAKEMVTLAKAAKPFKDALEKAKVANPQKAWDDYSDAFIKSSEDLNELLSGGDAPYAKAKAAFGVVKKSCADCHKDFRVEDEF